MTLKTKGSLRRVLRPVLRLIQKSIVRYQYGLISGLDLDDDDLLFLNYGYLDDDTASLHLKPDEDPFRTSIHLYHRTAALGDPAGKAILEVGCGRGGGAAYVMRALGPAGVNAVDLSPVAIEFCRRHFADSGVQYEVGDAEKLPFDDASFDIVLNVESSHCYPRLGRFLKEVHRVLKPGGVFCYTDFRGTDQLDEWRSGIQEFQLVMDREEDITPHVVAALAHDNERKLALIDEKVPDRMREYFEKFAAIEGAPLNKAFKKGKAKYLLFRMRKPL